MTAPVVDPGEPYYREHDVTLHQGHVLDVLPTLEPESVNCVVTSPPYYGLRDYGVDGQIGLEPSPSEYVQTMRAVSAEVRRVLRPDGVLWLNLGDSYARGNTGQGNDGPSSTLQGGTRPSFREDKASVLPTRRTGGLDPKNLLGIPWRVAFALQDDGWTLRNAIVWNKSNAMPESVTDRLSSRYEHVFLFSKSRRYWFDLDPIREPHTDVSIARAAPHRAAPGKSRREGFGLPPGANPHTARLDQTLHAGGRNPGDVWTIPTSPFPDAHFATFPAELVRRCVLAGSPTDGTVLDPFAGAGTTLMVARKLLRNSVGIELNPKYCGLIVDRIGATPFDFGEPA